MAGADPNTSGKVQFIENHTPALEAGDYTITVSQQIQIPVKSVTQTFPLNKQEQKFSVLGPRFTLDPQEIQAVFPPPGSLGEHSNVLPHIILQRSTLPWERSANGEADVPWLALLLFDEYEVTKPVDPKAGKPAESRLQTLKVSELKQADKVKFPTVYDRDTVPKYPVAPYLELEYGDHDEDVVNVIDIPAKDLKAIMPGTANELKLLAHVRQTADAKGNPQGDEVAVVICNRLPKSGGMSIVHLVSVEASYDASGFVFRNADDSTLIRLVSLYSWRLACVSEKQTFKNYLLQLNHPTLFNIGAADNSGELTRLNIPARMVTTFQQCGHPLGTAPTVTDKGQWKISSGNTYYIIGQNLDVYDFTGRKLFKLDNASKPSDPVNPKVDEPKIRGGFSKIPLDKNVSIKAVCDHWWIKSQESNQQYVVSQEDKTLYVHHLDLDSSSTLRLPRLMVWDKATKRPKLDRDAESYFAMGSVALHHAMRQGNQSVSWYHGPLVPDPKPAKISLPIRSADELIRYSPAIGMFDVSYSAAWELGRLLTLQNKRASVDLFNWKRSHAQSIKDAEGQLDHLPFDIPTALDLPDSVRTWFADLALLKGVPFNYLVPDERMLPAESIRFFKVDHSWVECLLDGAFSVGRVLPHDHGRDDGLRKTGLGEHLKGEKQLSGFLLRSDVVSGWPGLLVDGYSDTAGKRALPLMRMDRLSKNVLLCLFDGIIQTVDIHLKPETLHFGVSEGDDDHKVNGKLVPWYKMKRDKEGNEPDPNDRNPKEVVLKDRNVVDITALAKKLTTSNNSAEFALQMIEGVERVRFVQGTR